MIPADAAASLPEKARRAVACGWLGATLAGGVEKGVEQQQALTCGAGCSGEVVSPDLPEQQQEEVGAVSSAGQQQQLACAGAVAVRAACNGSRQHQPGGSTSTRAQSETKAVPNRLLIHLIVRIHEADVKRKGSTHSLEVSDPRTQQSNLLAPQ